MEQLQILANVIAETYIRDLMRITGKATKTYEGTTGEVNLLLLSTGLVDNAVWAARNETISKDYVREAYKMLMAMISLDGAEYRLTVHGSEVIEVMTRAALRKNQKPTLQ